MILSIDKEYVSSIGSKDFQGATEYNIKNGRRPFTAVTWQYVAEYFSSLRKTVMKRPELVHNADESGCQFNNKLTKKLLSGKGSKAV
jgi:hypothetical protein